MPVSPSEVHKVRFYHTSFSRRVMLKLFHSADLVDVVPYRALIDAVGAYAARALYQETHEQGNGISVIN